MDWGLVRTLVPWLIIGAWIGSAIAGFLDSAWLRRAFGLFQIYTGLSMLLKRPQDATRKPSGTSQTRLVGTGIGTLGNGKYDALDDLRLWILDPDAAEDEPNFVEIDG